MVTVVLFIVSFSCRFLFSYRWESRQLERLCLLCGTCVNLASGLRPQAGCFLKPVYLWLFQSFGRPLLLLVGLVLLHADHQREHPHHQRLQVCGWNARQSLMKHFRLGILGRWCCFSTCSSRIKGWWVFHHYVSTVLSGVMLTWSVFLLLFPKCETKKVDVECVWCQQAWRRSLSNVQEPVYILLHLPK